MAGLAGIGFWDLMKQRQTDISTPESRRLAEQRRQGVVPVTVSPGHAHMEVVTRDLEAITVDVPAAERGSFVLEVAAVRDPGDDRVELVGGASQGAVDPGDVVGLTALPAAATGLSDDEALLGVRALPATVVTWTDAPPTLVVTGVSAADVGVGSMASR